jgi:hypothetical protein
MEATSNKTSEVFVTSEVLILTSSNPEQLALSAIIVKVNRDLRKIGTMGKETGISIPIIGGA